MPKKLAAPRRPRRRRTPQNGRTGWTIQLIPSGPDAEMIGTVELCYGPAATAQKILGDTGFAVHAEPHMWVPRVLVVAANIPYGGGFGKPLPKPVQLWTQPGDESVEVSVGFFLCPDQAFAIGDLTLRLQCRRKKK